jgi:TRAP-type C4-dicarboxylate transport system permease small subunit
VGSKFFHWPLPGSTELIGVIQVVMVAGGLAISKAAGNQIFIDLVMGAVPKRVKAGLEVFSALLGLALFVIIAWQIYLYGLSLFRSGTKTLLLGVPLYPFAFWVALCCIPIGLVILIELTNSIGKTLK